MTELADLFKANVLRLIADLNAVTDEHPLATIAQVYFECIDHVKLIRVFHERCTPLVREQLCRRDETFFRQSANALFGAELNPQYFNEVLRLYDQQLLTPDEKSAIWEYFDCFLELADQWSQKISHS